MTRRDVLTVATWAAATCGLALAALLPTTLDAVDDSQAPAAVIARPKITINGVEFSLRVAAAPATRPAGSAEPAAGQTVELVAVNITDADAQATCRVWASQLDINDMMSRVPRPPRSLWEEDQTIKLKARETRIITLKNSLSQQTEVTSANGVAAPGRAGAIGLPMLNLGDPKQLAGINRALLRQTPNSGGPTAAVQDVQVSQARNWNN